MIKKIKKPSVILVAILILASQASFISLPAKGAGSASLSLGTATLRKGCPGSIPININTGGEAVWAADVAMNVTGSAIIDSMVTGSALPMQTCNDTSLPGIMLCGARQAGSTAFTGAGVYGTINLTPAATGSLGINFDTASSNVINNDIQNVLGTATGASFTVQDRFNVEVDGTGFCNPDTTAPVITVDPPNGNNNVPLNTSIKLTLSDDRVGVNISTLTFFVNGEKIDTYSYTATGGTYTPSTPFELGERVTVEAGVCDKENNCRAYSGSFRTTPPEPDANCGNKVVEEGEECDEGHQTGTCDRDCTFVECGDGIINDVAGEQCDDFNTEDGDGCNSACDLEAPVEDLIYCPAPEVVELACPVPEEVAEQPEEEVDRETPALPEVAFEEADFSESAQTTVEAPLRPAAKSVILPATPEKKVEIDPCILKYGTEGANLDHDGDGLSDRTECYSETDPTKEDSDGDTCFDGEEINRFYTNPLVSDCSISDYVEEEILIIDPKPNWILTSIVVSGTAPRRSQSVGITLFPAIQKTFSKVLTQYEQFLSVLKRNVDPANSAAVQQKIADTTDSIIRLQTYIKDTQTFLEENSEGYENLSAELKRVSTFLDGGSAAVSNEIKEAETRFEALKTFETKSVFLGQVEDLQTVGVGNTTTAGFKLESKKELEDGVYDLVATAGFEDGGTKSSAPVRIRLSSKYEVEAPLPQALDGIPIGAEKIVTGNQKPVVNGKAVYGAMVFATWESLVLESSIITDSTEGIFDVQAPRNLEAGQDHTVTLYAVTETDGGFVRSKSTSVDFAVEQTAVLGFFSSAFYMIFILTLLSLLAFALDKFMERKKGKVVKKK